MSSELGNKLKVSIFGESHGKAIGVNINGLPAGEEIDEAELARFMNRRRPGGSSLVTPRNEADAVIIESGFYNGATTGTPLCAIIENKDTRSSDYSGFTDTPRPAHADYTAQMKWGGAADMRGSGHFSGRLTAPLCIAGGIAKQILERRGIYVGAHLYSVGKAKDVQLPMYPSKELFDGIAAKTFPVIDDVCGEAMAEEIKSAAAALDSVGGVIECSVIGLPVGLGGPMFAGIEGRMAYAMFGIPAVKGVEFGSGFSGSETRGTENNDTFVIDDSGNIATETNNCGGILGGISNGMPLVARVAMKPTPSIGAKQKTVSLSKKEMVDISVGGRHDPCVAVRAVPVVEAAAACVILDMLLEEDKL